MSNLTTQPNLTTDQVESFEKKGFLHLSGVISDYEVDVLSTATESLTRPAMTYQLKCPDYRYAAEPDSGKMVLRRVDNVFTKGQAFLNLCAHPLLLGICESIQGPDMLPGGLSLVIKAPGFGVAVPWHRDPANCKVRAGINIGVYLDDAAEENGMLYVLPESHVDLGLAVEGDTEEERFSTPGVVPVPTKAGDVVVHSEDLLHGSKEVHSQRRRRVLYFGCRTIPEQLSRGLDADWVRSVVRRLYYAIAERAGSEVADGETRYVWAPSSPEHRPVESDDYVELRIME
jgi:hypothetical protein